MKDFRIAIAQTILNVTTVAPIRQFRPPSVVAIGSKFDQTQEVLYNGISVDEFVVSSPTRLIVRIPSSQIGKPLKDFRVLADASVTKADALVTLGLRAPLKRLDGIDRLVQMWLMIFLSTPGTDVFDKSSGGGALQIVGRTTDSNGKGVAAQLALAVERTKSELLKKQASDRRIPQSERLLSSDLTGVEFDSETTALLARVSIQNMLGQSADVSLR